MRDDALDAASKLDSGLGQFFLNHDHVRECAAPSPVSLRNIRQQQAGFAGAGPRSRIRVMLRTPAGVVRCELLLDELIGGLAEYPHVVVDPRCLESAGRHTRLSPIVREMSQCVHSVQAGPFMKASSFAAALLR